MKKGRGKKYKREKKKDRERKNPFKKKKRKWVSPQTMGVTPDNGCHPRRIDVGGGTLKN